MKEVLTKVLNIPYLPTEGGDDPGITRRNDMAFLNVVSELVAKHVRDLGQLEVSHCEDRTYVILCEKDASDLDIESSAAFIDIYMTALLDAVKDIGWTAFMER